MAKAPDVPPTTDKVIHTKPHEKPLKADKKKISDRLVAKGVDRVKAKELSGEDDDNITAREIAEKRIAWQKTLKKA